MSLERRAKSRECQTAEAEGRCTAQLQLIAARCSLQMRSVASIFKEYTCLILEIQMAPECSNLNLQEAQCPPRSDCDLCGRISVLVNRRASVTILYLDLNLTCFEYGLDHPVLTMQCYLTIISVDVPFLD